MKLLFGLAIILAVLCNTAHSEMVVTLRDTIGVDVSLGKDTSQTDETPFARTTSGQFSAGIVFTVNST